MKLLLLCSEWKKSRNNILDGRPETSGSSLNVNTGVQIRLQPKKGKDHKSEPAILKPEEISTTIENPSHPRKGQPKESINGHLGNSGDSARFHDDGEGTLLQSSRP